ncbi:MAG: hypothetical protein GXP58_11300 [Deltaproteobacteria bacterium]|nr:hypothetical protein [Deltaproteobacteria bacterium]
MVMDLHLPVVVHFKEGEIRKGYTRNFAFFREHFDLTEVDIPTREEKGTVRIPLEDVKAVFYVKDFEGQPRYNPDPQAERSGFGDRVEVIFHDNETLVGYTPNYKEETNGFILYPADEKSNNEIVAVVRSATRAVKPEEKYSFFRP